MSYESGDDVALREKYARELLNMADEMSYDNSQRKYILEVAERIFRLKDPKMSDELREAYDMGITPLSVRFGLDNFILPDGSSHVLLS
jgi:hypothetical protein